MKLAVQVNEGPYQHQASDTAYHFTKAALEKRLAAITGGSGALCTASGMAAIATVLELLDTGDGIYLNAGDWLANQSYALFPSDGEPELWDWRTRERLEPHR